MAEPQAIPAATVIVIRDREQGPPELLIVERAAAMSFAAGALVFPGGRIDPADMALAATLPGDAEESAARIAAVRETLEEAAIAIGVEVAPGEIAALRDRLYAGEAMGELVGVPDLAALIPFARWLPHAGVAHKVFDTRFYLARAPQGVEPVVDGNENVRAFWTSARAVLDAADAGEVALIFPTRCNLERLARFGSFAEAVADAGVHPVRTVTPWIEARGGVEHLCIPDDLGYPVTALPLAGARRA